MRNLITDVAGVCVGSAHDEKLGSGVTALIFDAPATASIALGGGAPGLRDAALLEPGMTVRKSTRWSSLAARPSGWIWSAACRLFLREKGRGLQIGDQRVPIAPGAILFDLLNGGDKSFEGQPPCWALGYEAARAAARNFALGSHGAGSARRSPISKAVSAPPAPSRLTVLSSARSSRSIRGSGDHWRNRAFLGRAL